MALASSDKKLEIAPLLEKRDRGKKLSAEEQQFIKAFENGGLAKGPRPTPPIVDPRRLARRRARRARKLNR